MKSFFISKIQATFINFQFFFLLIFFNYYLNEPYEVRFLHFKQTITSASSKTKQVNDKTTVTATNCDSSTYFFVFCSVVVVSRVVEFRSFCVVKSWAVDSVEKLVEIGRSVVIAFVVVTGFSVEVSFSEFKLYEFLFLKNNNFIRFLILKMYLTRC
jgi:hypothetical protein